jgi:Tc toxin complex TcA C-terminal TcB-binding domain/Neuraminidase-like domain/Putative peptidoglycan binding domain
MNLQDRNLSQGTQGSDVKLLQKELRQLAYKIADTEVTKNLFGETTQQAVIDFQESHGLTSDGIVGATTAKELTVAIAGVQDPKNGEPRKNEPKQTELKRPSDSSKNLPPNGDPKPPKDIVPSSYVIQGQIRQTDKGPAVGLIVRAFNKDASGSETKLGESVSDKDGLYEISYPEVLFSKLSVGRGGLDMVLRVFDQTHSMNQGWNVVHITKPVENLDPREVSWLPWKGTEAKPFSVTGHVRWPDGRPATDLTVRAFDRDLRNEEQLGHAVTDKQGHYQINYFASQFLRNEKGSADLIVRVSDGAGTTPVSSPIIFNAKPVEIVDLTFGAESRALSEYETMIAELTPLLQSVPLSELVENDEHQDISFLSGETGFDPMRITWLVQAENLKRETQIRAEVFYGLFRQKLPTNLQDLLGPVTQPLRQSLERSVLDNIIPSLTADELDEIIKKLQSLRADLILKPADNNQQSSLGDLLNTTELSTDKKRIIAELHLEHDGPSEAFWTALKERDEFSEAEVKKVSLTVQLAALTGTHLPLVVELQALASKEPATGTNGVSASSLRPFARLDVADWKALLDQPQKNGQPIGVPLTTPGATPEEKADNYGVALGKYIEKALPTAVIASRLEKDPDSPLKSAQVDLKTFFDNNPSFEFKTFPVALYLSEGREEKLTDVSDPAALAVQLKRMGRVFNVVPRYPEMRALLADDLHSAQAIIGVGQRRFKEKYADSLGGPTKALEVFRTAEHVHATALNVYLRHAADFNSPTPYVISRGVVVTRVPEKGPVPDLATLFGSLDLCDCAHCASLYSPAAYFVDILKFLSDGPIRDQKSPLQVLLARRPDLEHIELTCENTNTQLPYVDLANEILEAAIVPRSFQIGEGPNVGTVLIELNSGEIPAAFKPVFAGNGYPLSDGASVRIEAVARVNVPGNWILLDGAWAFSLKRLGLNEGFQVFAWPQTSWTADELRANPEHVHDQANSLLRGSVFPWNLPLDLPLEEMHAYLAHLGVPRHGVMETFFPDVASDPLADRNIALEYLGLSREEADIVTGVVTGVPSGSTPSPQPWNFWGLQETGNNIADFTDGRAPHAEGEWDVVLQRVSIFLQQSGLTYTELLEVLGTYFINPDTSGGRTLGIVSVDPEDATTCKLSKLEIQVLAEVPNQRDALIASWDRVHRFVRLWRKLGWTMRDLDRAITALTPGGAQREITRPFLIKLSHIKRLTAQLNVPVVNMMSWFTDIDTAGYIDHLAPGQPEVASLYKQLFRNKRVIKPIDEAFKEDASALSGRISDHLPTLVAALGVSTSDLALLTTGGVAAVTDDNLNLTNLSKLYRVVSFAKSLKLSISEYQSIRKLSGIDPFAEIAGTPVIPATRSSLRFVETVDLIRSSGFSINELDYLLRHEFSSSPGVAPTDGDIAATLDEIRSELQRIAAENTVREAPADIIDLTTDTEGNVTRRKLSLLNWDTSLIEQLVATLNGSVVYEEFTDTLLSGVDLPNDTGNYEVDLRSLPAGFAFPDELKDVVTSAAKFLFACASSIPVESTGVISTALRNEFGNHSIALSAGTPVSIETPDKAWTIDAHYSVIKSGAILNVYDLHDKKLRASRRLSKPEGELLTSLAAASTDSDFINASDALLTLQEQLLGQITYDQVIVDGVLTGRLRFAGPMTNARKALLNSEPALHGELRAVGALFNAPRNFITRYARNFSIQDFATDLATLPASVTFPNALKSKVYFDTTVEPKRLHFIGVMTDPQRDLLLGLSTNPSDPAHTLYVGAVNDLFTQPDAAAPTFLTGPGAGTDAAELFDDPVPGERFLLVLKRLLPNLLQTLSEGLVAQKLTEALHLEAKISKDLLTMWVHSPTHATDKSITEFLKANFVDSSLNVKPTAATFPDQFQTFKLLDKIARLVTKFKITASELPWLFEHGPSAGWLNFNALPLTATPSSEALFGGWSVLVGLSRLRDKLPIDSSALFNLFELTLAQGPTSLNEAKQAYLESLSKITSCPIEELETLLGSRNQTSQRGFLGFVFPGNYKDGRVLLRLLECFRLMKRSGTSARQLSDWRKPDQTISEELSNARSVKNTVKAKYDDGQWPAVAKPLKDPLREKQRSALVSYLVSQRGVRDANELYDDFLIDVEMSPCMMTTRIKQAISSVQLFIQGFLMNLGQDVSLTPDEAEEWEGWREEWKQWRKWYRVWEANRKVLLYPENWIEPELRDDKSPFFQDLENELLQGDVTMATAEDAFVHYLEKLDQVARLEIVGMYCQDEPKEILHVFGRTYAIPHLYFYRRLEDKVWSAWEKVDLDIEGDHLIPVAWNRRLYLFWSIFTEKSEQPTKEQRVSEDDPNKYWEIKLAWSEYKNKSWSPKRVSKNFLQHNQYPYMSKDAPADPNLDVPQKPENFSFKSRIFPIPTGEQLGIECYGTTVVKDLRDPGPLPVPPPPPVNVEQLAIIFAHTIFVLFRGDVPQPTFIKFSLRIDGQRPIAANTRIELRRPSGFVLETIALNSNGVAYSTRTYTEAVVPYLLSSDYKLDTFREEGSWWMPFNPAGYATAIVEAAFDAVALAGPRVSDGIVAAITAGAVAAAVVAASGAIPASLGDVNLVVAATLPAVLISITPAVTAAVGTRVGIGMAAAEDAGRRPFGRRISIKLKAVPAPAAIRPPDPVYETRVRRMQGIGVFTLDGCNRDLVVTPVASPPEKFATLLRMSSPPDHRFRMLFKKNGDSALAPADIADIRIFRTRQYQLSALETFGLNSAGTTADTVYSENSDFYLVSRRFSVASVSSQPNLLGGSLGMIVNVVLRPSSNSANGPAALMIPTQLEPIPHTRIENMMLVEFPGDDSLSTGFDERGARITLLNQTPGNFRLLAPHQDPQFTNQSPFFFQDGLRTYFVSRRATGNFAIHFHPRMCALIKALNRDGVSGLLTLQNQGLDDSGTGFWTTYEPTPLYQSFDSAPKENVDFEDEGAYSLYNWELFFHIPFLIATQLSKNQRFEEAQQWFHFIFDPTAPELPNNPSYPGTERFWCVKPFHDRAQLGIQTLEALLAESETFEEQVTKWEANPFKPHLIARMRVVAYMKSVVMRYIDNLLAWGDQLFRRDTIESINEATQLYILAGQILGRRSDNIPARAKAKIQTFRTLDDVAALDSLSNAMVEIESFLAPSFAPALAVSDRISRPLTMRYFGIPGNDKLLSYWDTVADRLFKIRHCLNIEGVERSLPIFEPPIDPALLVRAAAAGVDINSALNDINAAVPHYRFNVMVQKAAELCNDVKALGSALLSALEKRDAEALALLRSSHEVDLLDAIREIKAQQIDEASNTLEGLRKYEDVVTTRQQYYLSRPFMNPFEMGHLELVGTSLLLMGAQVGAEVTAAVLHLIPDSKLGAPPTIGATYGGRNVASAVQSFGSVMGTSASILNTIGSLSATLGGFQRRQDDWTHQAELATKELKQVQKQIAAAEIRLAISEHELQNHELQIEHSKEVDAYMRSQKFTNQELYNWMLGKLSGIYFQSYQLAYDVAKRAERAYRHELGLKDSNFIQFGYWDSLRKGLLSGERLHHDLKRMDVAYLDQNKREYEITKHISLLAIDPTSFVTLKETGECQVSLPETLFDIDYPGHYMRRIKSVSITVPCVTGPYAGVNCTLTQLNSSIRHANTALGAYGRRDEDTRFSDSFGAVQSIVTSHGQGDGGLFETNLRDERYLPFEGAGVISTWRIELPSVLSTFDYSTISDVVLHVRYTARDGGRNLKQRVTEELTAALNLIEESARGKGLARLFSLRQEFPTEWHRLISGTNGNGAGALPHFFGITKNRFPFLFTQKDIKISAVELYAVPKSDIAINEFPTLDIKLPMAASVVPMQEGVRIGNLLAKTLTLSTELTVDPEEGNAQWEFQIPQGRLVNFQQEINDILMVCHYTI